MAIVKRHIPAFVNDGEGRTQHEYETQEELLALDWVDAWSRDPGFYRFSIAHQPPEMKSDLLMAERNEGTEWWVVAYLYHPTATLTLPEWEKKEKRT